MRVLVPQLPIAVGWGTEVAKQHILFQKSGFNLEFFIHKKLITLREEGVDAEYASSEETERER